MRTLLQFVQHAVDKVKAGLYRDDVTRLQDPGQTKIRVAVRCSAGFAGFFPQSAACIMNLEPQKMAEAVRKECT